MADKTTLNQSVTSSCRRPGLCLFATSFWLIAIVIFVIHPAGAFIDEASILSRFRVFARAVRCTRARHGTNDPMLCGRRTAVSPVPSAVLVIVNRVAPSIGDFALPTTADALQIGGIWIPVEFLCARDDHAPHVFASL